MHHEIVVAHAIQVGLQPGTLRVHRVGAPIEEARSWRVGSQLHEELGILDRYRPERERITLNRKVMLHGGQISLRRLPRARLIPKIILRETARRNDLPART